MIKAGSFSSIEELKSLLVPVTLSSFGNENAEKAEILQKFGWRASEVGQFYPRQGHSWYYFVYGNTSAAANVPENRAMSLALRKRVRGDVLVVHSGPAGADYPTDIPLDDLARDILFYENHDPRDVYAEREKMRFFGNMGLSSMADSVQHFSFSM